MCGIVGMAGNLNTQHAKMFRNMLFFDTNRGLDSTGVVYVPMTLSGEIKVEKDVGAPSNLWEFNDSEIFNDEGRYKTIPRALIGHNRKATKGKITRENAHPFSFNHIHGVHNGSLINYSKLEGYEEFDVDSKCIFKTIEEKGIEHCWANFHGPAALVWWDDEEKTLNFIRNKERPLVFAQNKAKNALFWASEPWMIIMAANLAKIELLPVDEDKGIYCKNFTENYHYVFKPTSTTCPQVGEATKLKPMDPPTYPHSRQSQYGGYAGGYGGHYDDYENYMGGSYAGGGDWADYRTPHTVETDWAKDKIKASKEYVGKHIEVTAVHVSGRGTETAFKVYGRIRETGEAIEIFPTSVTEYNEWVDFNNRRRHARGMNDHLLRITARPRVRTNPPYWAHKSTFLISSASVEEVEFVPSKDKKEDKAEEKKQVVQEVKPHGNVIYLGNDKGKEENPPTIKDLFDEEEENEENEKTYLGPGKDMLTERQWKDQIERTSDGCCSFCGNPLSIEQHRDIDWVSKDCVLCETCKKDDDVRTYLGGVFIH